MEYWEKRCENLMVLHYSITQSFQFRDMTVQVFAGAYALAEIAMTVYPVLLDPVMVAQKRNDLFHGREMFVGGCLFLKIAQQHYGNVSLVLTGDMGAFIGQGTSFPYTSRVVYNEVISDISVMPFYVTGKDTFEIMDNGIPDDIEIYRISRVMYRQPVVMPRFTHKPCSGLIIGPFRAPQ